MKFVKYLLSTFVLLLLLLVIPTTTGCTFYHQSDIREVIKSEFDQLKELNTKTTQKYISYKELFPDATENTQLSDEINEVFSLFFQKFDYKILDISVDNEYTTATASLKLTTIDAKPLAADFAAQLLKLRITEAAQKQSDNAKDSSKSLKSHYLILNQLLSDKEYETTDTDCTIQLINRGDNEHVTWEIKRTYSLENDLVGGLITCLSDPNILSPENTLSVYLDTLKKMDLNEMSTYLGVVSVMNTSDSSKNLIAEALVEQVHQNFNYEILSSNINGYNATVTTKITTFDSNSILSIYQASLEEYLDSADAVIDGSQMRYERSLEFLLESISKNTATTSSEVEFVLINDGASWKLQDEGNTLGNAIFSTLTDSPLALPEQETEESTEEMTEE